MKPAFGTLETTGGQSSCSQIKEGVRSYDYYGRLAKAEGDIEDHEDLKVSLVPVLPG